VDSRWATGAGVARIPEPPGAVVTIAAGVVLGLALALMVTVFHASSLPVRTRRFLLLVALIAGILAALRWQGTL
jgi:hypothetical protein